MDVLIVQTKKDVTLFYIGESQQLLESFNEQMALWEVVGADNGFEEKRFAGIH